MEESVMTYSTRLGSLAEEFKLEVIYAPEGYESKKIYSADVSRPGLALGGFFDCFDNTRIQIIGKAEHHFLASLSDENRLYRLEQLGAHNPPAIIVTTGLSIFDGAVRTCQKYKIPLFRTQEMTSSFMAAFIASLNLRLAPRITRHGVLVEVYGEGILILGDSGIGKSETAIELVKRGHRLIADDAVEIKKASAKTLFGTAPEIIRHFVELRGIGIVDIRRIFGMGAVKETEKIDMIVKLEQWDQNKSYDRLGLESEYTDIMGIQIATTTIPVRPGRNLAIVIEIAAMNNRQKKMGYNTAEEFNKRLMDKMKNGGDED